MRDVTGKMTGISKQVKREALFINVSLESHYIHSPWKYHNENDDDNDDDDDIGMLTSIQWALYLCLELDCFTGIVLFALRNNPMKAYNIIFHKEREASEAKKYGPGHLLGPPLSGLCDPLSLLVRWWRGEKMWGYPQFPPVR